MSKDTQKVIRYTNPATAAAQLYTQATGQDIDPTLKYRGGELNLLNAGSPHPVAVLEGSNVAKQVETARQTRIQKDQLKKDLASDATDFEKFKSQESDLAANPSTELFVPAYRKNNKSKAETEALVNIFNARKSEILSRQRAPGISQTRMAY